MNSRTTYQCAFFSFAALFALVGCGGGPREGTGSTKQAETCDPTLVCGQALTCVDGQQYPTTCGPTNCDKPIGPCDGSDAAPADPSPTCDPTLVCGQALTCVDGQQYPTTCGPTNCDKPIGPC
jgi:hypothetical protein